MAKPGATRSSCSVGTRARTLLRIRDRRSRAGLPHEPCETPDLGDRPRDAARGALLARRGLRRGRQPDGRRFALGSQAGRVRLLDLRSGEIRRSRAARRRASGANSRPTARTLVTSGTTGGHRLGRRARRDRAALARHTADRLGSTSRRRAHAGHRGGRHGARSSGTSPATGGSTGASRSRQALLSSLDVARGDRGQPRRAHARGHAQRRDGRPHRHRDAAPPASVPRHRRLAGAVAFSPDGRLLAVTGEGGRVTLWNARTRAPAGELRGLRADSQALAFSPDGGLLAAAEAGSPAAAHAGSGTCADAPRRAFAASAPTSALAFSPDETLIAAANGLGEDGLRSAMRAAAPRSSGWRRRSPPRSVAFSPDGEPALRRAVRRHGALLSTEGWKPVGPPLEAHAGIVMSTEFTPDGRVLVTAGADGTVALWDVETRKPIGSPVTVAPNTMVTAAFSPDGSRLTPSRPAARGSASTRRRRPGSATPASSPGATSRPSGTTRLTGLIRPSARASERPAGRS